MKSSTLPTILSCHFSQNSGKTNCPHVRLKGQADKEPQRKGVGYDYGVVGCLSSRINDLSVHARNIILQFFFASYGNQMHNATIFEVKVGKTSERAVKKSRERSAEQVFGRSDRHNWRSL